MLDIEPSCWPNAKWVSASNVASFQVRQPLSKPKLDFAAHCNESSEVALNIFDEKQC